MNCTLTRQVYQPSPTAQVATADLKGSESPSHALLAMDTQKTVGTGTSLIVSACSLGNSLLH